MSLQTHSKDSLEEESHLKRKLRQQSLAFILTLGLFICGGCLSQLFSLQRSSRRDIQYLTLERDYQRLLSTRLKEIGETHLKTSEELSSDIEHSTALILDILATYKREARTQNEALQEQESNLQSIQIQRANLLEEIKQLNAVKDQPLQISNSSSFL